MKTFPFLMLVILAGASDDAEPLHKFRPRWQVGQQWTVETQSRQQQTALPQQQAVTARWRFAVEAVDQIQGKPCWRIAIRLLEGDRVLAEPKTTVWVDQAAAAIRQMETQLPTPQGYKSVTESYQSGAQAAPVVGPLSVLPLALPQFPEQGIKAIGTFEYQTVSGPGGVKAVGEASAKIRPWSGYWWPIREGRLLVPLGKYDRLTGQQAAVWERKTNPPGHDVPRWHGYCHAWAAAAMLESEPDRDRTVRAESLRVGLDVGDQKGLLTACHTEDPANSWGDRFGDGQGSEDPQDMRPDLLWRLLKLHLGQQGVPLVLDVEAGEEVWNYPVYEYQMSYRPVDGGGESPAPNEYRGDLTLLMADDGVPPAYRGTKIRKQTCQFTFQMRAGNVVMGSGRWTGPSANVHPDFAWYPYQAVAANPEVKYPKVQKLVTAGQAVPPATLPDTPPTPPPATPPTAPPAKPKPPVPPPAQPPVAPKPPAQPPVTPLVPPSDTQPKPSPPKPAVKPLPAPPVVNPTPVPVVLSPLELAALIANRTSSFPFDATVDRFDGGTYKPGETFFVRALSCLQPQS